MFSVCVSVCIPGACLPVWKFVIVSLWGLLGYACAHVLHLFTPVSVCVGWRGGAEGALPLGFQSGPLINPFSGRRVSVIRPLQRAWLRPNSTIPGSTTQVHTQKHTVVLLHLWGHSMHSLALNLVLFHTIESWARQKMIKQVETNKTKPILKRQIVKLLPKLSGSCL